MRQNSIKIDQTWTKPNGQNRIKIEHKWTKNLIKIGPKSDPKILEMNIKGT